MERPPSPPSKALATRPAPTTPLRPPSTRVPATQPRVPAARGAGSGGGGGGGGVWMRWPEVLIPAEGRLRCVAGRSGRVIAMGRHRDHFFAIDARCYHMGEHLCASVDPVDGHPVGDIEDDGAVVCPAHAARIRLADGHVHGRGRAQRTLAVRHARDGGEEGLEVYVEPLDGTRESDNYNTGEPLSACRARARKHAMARAASPRRLIELGDDTEDVTMADAAATAPPSRDSPEGTAEGIVPMES